MVRAKAARERTAFTQSIEAREGVSTGISAHDRARTIATAIDPTKGASDLVSPGHVFPLIAREGGVLIRAGHTEATVDLCRLAGLVPAAVICEIMNDDGTMARMPDLVPFAQRHGLKIGTIEDLIAYRLRHESLVKRVAQTTVESGIAGSFTLNVFTTTVEPVEHLALGQGDLSAPGPSCSSAFTPSTCLAICLASMSRRDASCKSPRPCMRSSVKAAAIIVLIRDLGPKSVSDWVQRRSAPAKSTHALRAGAARSRLASDRRSCVISACHDMVLLTNTPTDVYVGLEAYGLRIVGTRAVE